METQKYDAIVIGSGIGGLTTAALLAKLNKKKVLVIEKHWVLGGQTHVFHRKGKFKWDVGIHYVPGVGENDMAGEIFEYITDGKLKWNKLPHEFEKFIYPDFTFVVPSDKTEYLNKLIAQYPDEEKAIKKYFKDIEKTGRWASMDIAKKALPFYMRFFINIFNSFNKRISLGTTGEYLDSHFKDKKLKALLASQWGDYGLPPSKSAFAIHALIVQSYFNGAYYPKGGGKSIASSIKPVIEKAGGKCLLNSEVTGLIIAHNTAIGVKVKPAKGENREEYDIYAPLVISNVGAYNTYKYLLKENSNPQILKSMEDMQTGDSSVSLYVGLKDSPAKLGFSGRNNWICDGYDHDKIQKENNLLIEPKSCFLSFPSLKSNDGYNHTAEIITFVNYSLFKKWEESNWLKRDDEYYKLKETISNNLLNLVEKHFPGFKDMVSYTELSTPLTMKSFVNWNKGMYNGIPATPKRYKMDYLKPQTPVKNFYMTGCDISSLGIVGAMMGGVAAASLQNGLLGFIKIIGAAKKEKSIAMKESKNHVNELNPVISAA
jgi:phytoene dehydrogenase-like protein